MYSVILMPGGKYRAYCMIQDGTEHGGPFGTEAEAIEWVKDAARVMNWAKIRTRDINFYEVRPVQQTELVKVRRPRKGTP